MPPKKKTKKSSAAKKSIASPQKISSSDYDTKFGSLEVVLAASGSTGDDRFFVGRLQEDVLMGDKSGGTVSIQWFDRVGDDTYTAHREYDDNVPIGSLVCSVIQHIHPHGVNESGDEMIRVMNSAFEYGDKKLAQQTQDEYDSDEDSHFQPKAVAKRLIHLEGKKHKNVKTIHIADDDDDDNDEKKSSKKGKRKASASSKTSTTKKMKVGRGLTPRPNVKLLPDSFTGNTSPKVDTFDGDIERASKEAIRFVRVNNTKALKSLVQRDPRIGHLYNLQSAGVPLTALMWAMGLGNVKAVEVLLKALREEANNTTTGRVSTPFQKCALPVLTTGKQTSRHANYNRRKINASRGGREGNNALLHDAQGDQYARHSHYAPNVTRVGGFDVHAPNRQVEVGQWNLMADFDEISPRLLDVMEASFPEAKSMLRNVHAMILAGHTRMAERFIAQEMQHTFQSNSFNFLHRESLSSESPKKPDAPFSKEFQAKSVVKMSSSATRFTPLMCACINPDAAYLRALLKVAPEHASSVDTSGHGLLHYAAACTGTCPLECLIKEFSLPVATAISKQKETPLHIAAKTSRPDNVRLLLEGSEDSFLHAKSTHGFSALHYAVKSRRARNWDTVRTLIEMGADANMASTASRNKITPVHLAAIVGDLDILKVLIESGKGNPSKGDKLGRSPLIHACMCGHVHIVSYLLRLGVNVEAGDSSDNKPVHYAAAYGWDDCVQVLVAGEGGAGADPDPKNSWKTTPLSVAIQKGRNRVARILLDLPTVDINFHDDSGQTLFLRLVEGFIATNLLSEATADDSPSSTSASKASNGTESALMAELPWALQRLLDRSDLDIASTNNDGRNFLHLICQQTFKSEKESKAVQLAKLILSCGDVSLDDSDGEGVVPVVYAALNGNDKLFEFLVRQGATATAAVVDKREKNIAHHILGLRPDESMKKLELLEGVIGDKGIEQLMMATDAEGLTPLHEAVQTMMSQNFGDARFTSANSCIKSIVTRFPSLAIIRVKPTKLFTDSEKVAQFILESSNEEEDARSSNRHRRPVPHLQGLDRLNPEKINQALQSPHTVIPLESVHFGKSILHLACETQIPSRCSTIMDWLLPLSKEVAGLEGGRGGAVATPLHTLLYNVLPGALLREGCQTKQAEQIAPKDKREGEGGLFGSSSEDEDDMDSDEDDSDDDNVNDRAGTTDNSSFQEGKKNCIDEGQPASKRMELISVLLDVVEKLLKASAVAVNFPVKGLFENEEERKHYAAMSKDSFEKSDQERKQVIRRLAKSLKRDTEDKSGGDSVVASLRDLMANREKFTSAHKEPGASGLLPLCLTLASISSSQIPLGAWERLHRSCGLDLSCRDEVCGDTALHVSLRSRNKIASRFIVDHAPALLNVPNSSNGELPLHITAKLDDAFFVKLILGALQNKEIEINRGDSSGRTAVHYSVEKAAQRTAEVLEPCEILFIRAGARLDIADGTIQRNPLHWCFLESPFEEHANFPHSLSCSKNDRVDLASSLLAAAGAANSVNMRDRFGRTPLFYASAYGSTVSSLLLCSKGADLFEKDDDGNTPIGVAILRGHDQYVVSMLKSVNLGLDSKLEDVHDVRRSITKNETTNSTDVKITSKTTHSIVWHAIKADFRGLVYILLESSFSLAQAASDALDCGAFSLARKLFSTSPPDVIRFVNPESGYTLLHEVANVRRFENEEWSTVLANLLLESGVPPARQSLCGRTPLHLAAANHHLGLSLLLVEKDASSLVCGDSDGSFPLALFMRNLRGKSVVAAQSLQMMEALTTGMNDLSNDACNKVPKTKETVIDHKGVEFCPGPNRETVDKDIKQKLAATGTSQVEEEQFSGRSTILIQALIADRPMILQKLIDKGALMDMPDSSGLLPIHHAVLSASYNAVARLLRNGAGVNSLTIANERLTPLILAVTRLGEAKSTKDKDSLVQIIAMLLRNGADATLPCNNTKRNALHFACLENNMELASLIIRVANHSARMKKAGSSKLPKHDGIFLVRFKGDTGLVPCNKKGSRLQVRGDSSGASYPLSTGSAFFKSSELCLDSLESLVKLKLRVDGKHGPAEENAVKKKLSAHYGAEYMVVGDQHENLTKPLGTGNSVIVQFAKERGHSSSEDIWLEGWIAGVNKNGTYNVEVLAGPLVKGVLRLHIRPWSHLKNVPKSNKPSSIVKALLSAKDTDGKTPMVAAIRPLPFGSYENVKMVELLLSHGASIARDEIPLSRPNSKLRRFLCEVAKLDDPDKTPTAEQEKELARPGLEPIGAESFEADTKAALEALESSVLKKLGNYAPPVNKMSELKSAGIRVLQVANPNNDSNPTTKARFFDLVMTKVEMNHYGYSENKYYKMQIVEDVQKSMFVLVTNWGQVGDGYGNKQETPFGSREEAITEFTKVFKSKTGNAWENYQESTFEPKLGKYKPINVLESGYSKPKLPDILKLLDDVDDHPDIERRSALDHPVLHIMKAFVDPSVISKAASSLGLQQEQLPLGRLSIQTLLAAEQKLEEVEKAIEACDSFSGSEKLQQKRDAMEKVAILSCQYFEMLPTKEGDEALRPLDAQSATEQKRILLSLKDLTVSSQIICCANFKAVDVHPLDYAYRALNASIQVLDAKSPERIGAEQYFRNTCNNNDLVINEVFSVHRHAEAQNERFSNHRLLWHGTNVANLMGVIKEGLRVAPPTAQRSGSAFGHGVYFADMASKSWNYCRANFKSGAKEMPRAYLLLADVALGEQVVYTGSSEDIGFDKGDSILAVGCEGPDEEKDVVFNKTGTVVPLGRVVANKTFSPFARWRYGYQDAPKAISEKLESLLSSPDTVYPASFESEFSGNRVQVHLEHGPYSESARIAPIRKRKKKKSGDNGSDDDEADVPAMRETILKRHEIKKNDVTYVHFNEYVVEDLDRINLKYIVEVTSRSWLENAAKKLTAGT